MLPTLMKSAWSPGAMKPIISNMFRYGKTADVITLFHAPSVPASVHALTILKQASAQAQATATEDQASDHSHQNKVQRSGFELEISETTPTEDQLKSILEYFGGENAGSIVQGATSVSDAVKKLKASSGAFQRPVVVDWNAGKVVVGDNESEILKLVNQHPE